MLFKELKSIINRQPGRHDRVAIHIDLGCDAIVESESEILDFLDDYNVKWIAPSTVGKSSVTDEEEPCIEIHLDRPIVLDIPMEAKL